jgi:hypothetical protein
MVFTTLACTTALPYDEGTEARCRLGPYPSNKKISKKIAEADNFTHIAKRDYYIKYAGHM